MKSSLSELQREVKEIRVDQTNAVLFRDDRLDNLDQHFRELNENISGITTLLYNLQRLDAGESRVWFNRSKFELCVEW